MATSGINQRMWKGITIGAVAVLAVTFAPNVPTYAKPTVAGQQVPKVASVPGAPATAKPVSTPKVKQFVPAAPAWPAPAVAEVDLTGAGTVGRTARSAGAAEGTRAGALPVWIAAASAPAASGAPSRSAPASSARKVRVEMLDRAQALRAGHDLAVRLSPSDGAAEPVKVRIEHAAFRSAYGADWASRLRLVRLPECALTKPADPRCTSERLPSTVDGSAVSAAVNLAGASTIVALSSGASGASGDYAATSLSPSSTWSAGGSTGDFSWSYDVRTPPAFGGPAPSVSLGYSSQAVDGRMVSTNNQPSWVGEGFDYSPGFIERRYVSCSDDMSAGNNNTTKVWDQCWKTDNATLSLNGSSTELIYNAAEKRWRGRTENGSYVERLTGAANGDQGDDDDKGEHWVVTTSDGTKYWFGLNRLQGWTPTKSETSSVLLSPVFGNHPQEPCHKATFAASSCSQAYRWNLDYVVDRHGNTMSMWYGKDTNQYGRNKSTTDLAGYDRDGYLKRIDYGTHQRGVVGGVLTDSVFTAVKPPMQVQFDTADRCFEKCADKANWQDTPFDQQCTGKTCDDHSPTFWSTRRLSTITTKAWNAAAKDYRDVERWSLTHKFPDPGDGTPGSLWLSELAHEGLSGTKATVPNIVFTPVSMDNRVDTALRNGLRPIRRQRIDTIVTETGATIDVNYKGKDCVAGKLPAAESNTRRCYPVRWAPEDLGEAAGAEITDFFHKYVVDNVVENDSTGRPMGSPLATVTHYDYEDADGDGNGAAWRYADDDGLTKANRRTWNQWRGYELVRTWVGKGDERSMSETRYFRGMHGDRKTASGGSRVVQVTDSKKVATLDDHPDFAGMRRETIAYNGPGKPISGALETPWRSAPTATRDLNGQQVHARFTGLAETRTWTALDGGRPDRWTRIQHELDGYGMAVRSTDHGDTGVSGDEQCTLTDYARNTDDWLVSYPSRVRTFALTCAAATQAGRVFGEDDIIADVKTSFDGKAWGVPPSIGETTLVEELAHWRNNAPHHAKQKRMAYDPYGRISDLWDVADRHTTTRYTPAEGGPVTKVVNTNPAGWTDTTETDALGNATLVVDANGRSTTKTYDGLGRLTAVWLPGRSTTAKPDYAHAYGISNTTASFVETKTLNPAGAQVTMVEFYDALLRVRQRQWTSAAGTGRVISDNFYDSAGRQWLSWGPYSEQTKGVQRELWRPSDGSDKIDIWHRMYFDGAGRPRADVQYNRLTEKWRTTTTYAGDRTTVVPPEGGTATTTVVDARGRTTELLQHRARDLTGGADRTLYFYDRKGKQSKVRNAEETEWSFDYDIRGRLTVADDPDKGKSHTSYDAEGRVQSVSDGRQRVLSYGYDDPLGRRTALYEGPTAGPDKQLAAWAYDGVLDKTGKSISRGMVTSSTRFVGGAAGSAYRKATTGLDAAGRPTTTAITIPPAETGLSGTYEYQNTYLANGTVGTTRLPAIGGTGGLGVETLTVGYQATGLPVTLGTNLGSSYVVSTGYTEYGETGLLTLRNNSGKVAQVGQYYDDSTRRLNRIWTTRENNPASISDLYYDYDAAGNVTSIAETSATVGAEKQCFRHDHLRRLAAAWTPTDPDCKKAPSAQGLSRPAPYWTSWKFDAAGNRTEQVEHSTAAGKRTTTYTYPPAKQPQPHTLLTTTSTDDTGTQTAAYRYDQAGNTITRPAPTGAQTLDWNAEGRLERSSDGSGETTYLYDADGTRLIRKDPTGTTLYLPAQELRVDRQGTPQVCSRYYSHGGRAVAMRTGTGVTWLAGDHQGTVDVAIDATSQQFSARRQDPYGNPRGAPTGAPWPSAMDKGFVGGTRDNSGLTHLGAREYDPGIGRFVSVDPIVDFTDSQQTQGYAYANNTPVTMSDPDGLVPLGPDDQPYTGGTGGNSRKTSGPTDNSRKTNPYGSDAEERRATGNAAEAQRIRQIRYRQIMEGRFGIRQKLEELADEMLRKQSSGNGRGGLGRQLGKELGPDFTEDKLTEILIKVALDRIDESRHDNKNRAHEDVAFDDEEFVIAFQLAMSGSTVESRDESLKTVGNPDGRVFDAYVDDVRSEFKSLHTNNSERVSKDYSNANKQHAVRLYLYTGDDVEEETVKEGQNHFHRHSHKRSEQSLREVGVLGNVQAKLQPIRENLDCRGWDWWKGC